MAHTKEEELQTQEEKKNKTPWKPFHTPNKPANELIQDISKKIGKLNNFQYNSFNNFYMQETKRNILTGTRLPHRETQTEAT